VSSASLQAATEVPAMPRKSWRQHYPAVARFMRSTVSIVALVLLLLIILATTFGPLIWTKSPIEGDLSLLGDPQPPSWAHPAGVDNGGRDMLARLLLGARISLAVGFVSMMINMVIGVGIGTIAGWVGGWVDVILMRIVDALYSIPLLLVVIILQLFLKPVLESVLPADMPMILTPELISIYIALGLTNWLTMARLARSEVINQSQRDYVSACHALGIGQVRILLRHVLPNCAPPLLVAATLAIPEAIFIEAFLAFIGLGVSHPVASWGSLANDGVRFLSSDPYLLLFPALAISITMLSFNLFGDGLRDALDPSGRR
jgi:oligopeptide transport system permease protein